MPHSSSSRIVRNSLAATSRHLQVADFDFDLPPELIAQHPAAQRTASRLLDGCGLLPVDCVFSEFAQRLRAGDLVVFNDTKVVKARLLGHKPSGGSVELLIERVLQGQEVVAHMKSSRKPAVGSTLHMDGGFGATLLGRWPDAQGDLFHLRLHGPAGEDPYTLMERHGHVPLPPYITHGDSAEDVQRYQSVFARHPGAVAAPTAALHFDEKLLAELTIRGIQTANVTLHVGAGTFQPVKVERLADHQMHNERYNIPTDTMAAIEKARARGARIVAVGTTSVRTLESWAASGQTQGETAIFITPGFPFKVVDLLLTNFHLPRSTLLMLVSAFAGHAHIMRLYQHAITRHYRFFSYGDAMLLQRAQG